VVSDNLVPRWGEHSEFRAVRLGAFKYVGFRDGSELFFNLEADPGELRDLSKVDLEAAPADILERCRAFVKATMDFEAVQQERVAFSRELAEHYSLNGRKTQNNLYHFKDGRIVNGEDVVYNPIVVARDPSELFGQDWVEKNQQNQKPLGSPGA
jgi:arylsulfatase A-like enzyme